MLSGTRAIRLTRQGRMTVLQPRLADFARALEAASAEAPGGADMLVVVAHPDDETIGIGGHLRRLRLASIVHLTDGAPRDGRDASKAGFATPAAYATARHRELEGAMKLAGIETPSLMTLGLADQEAARAMPAIARRLRALIEERHLHFVLTHPFEGGHPDHDAAALAVRAACDAIGHTAPAIIEMASYHLGPAGPIFQRFGGAEPELAIVLDADAFALKQRMLACHATQARTLETFGAAIERFRLAPRYDFTRLPNDGRLAYDKWLRGFTSGDWLDQARRAVEALALRPG